MSSNTLNKTTRELIPFSGSKSYSSGDGITVLGNELNLDLKDSTLSSLTAGDRSSDGCEYPIGLDLNGKLSVNVPSGGKYALSDTTASTVAKTASTANGDFVLQAGNSIKVKFIYENTASSPTLNIDDTGSKSIKGYGSTDPSIWWSAGDVVEFVYDGTYWVMQPTQGQITELNSALNSNYTFGTPIDITNVTSSNPYVSSSNGVIELSGGNHGFLIRVRIDGIRVSNPEGIDPYAGDSIVPIRKGQSVYTESLLPSANNQTAKFYPYVIY